MENSYHERQKVNNEIRAMRIERDIDDAIGGFYWRLIFIGLAGYGIYWLFEKFVF